MLTVSCARNIDWFLRCFLKIGLWAVIRFQIEVGCKKWSFMRRADTQRRDSEGLETCRTRRLEAGRRAAGLSKWKALHQSRGIPAFSSSFFCYSLERVALFFSPSAPSPPDLGTDKEGEGRGGEGRQGGGEEWVSRNTVREEGGGGGQETMFLQFLVLL